MQQQGLTTLGKGEGFERERLGDSETFDTAHCATTRILPIQWAIHLQVAGLGTRLLEYKVVEGGVKGLPILQQNWCSKFRNFKFNKFVEENLSKSKLEDKTS